MKIYRVKTKFRGFTSEMDDHKFYIAVPDFKLVDDLKVKFGAEAMIIKKGTPAVTYRHQEQKNQRKKDMGIPYIVAYFEWAPIKEPDPANLTLEGAEKMLEAWRKVYKSI